MEYIVNKDHNIIDCRSLSLKKSWSFIELVGVPALNGIACTGLVHRGFLLKPLCFPG